MFICLLLAVLLVIKRLVDFFAGDWICVLVLWLEAKEVQVLYKRAHELFSHLDVIGQPTNDLATLVVILQS